MSDYIQPQFYRFNEDSLLLVKEVAHKHPKAESILDIGAGSGVIGIELAMRLKIPVVHFVELQEEWKDSLETNIHKFLPGLKAKIYWTRISSWEPERKYDLIVSNPPYYLPRSGKLSPDPIRAKCRSFLEDNWEILLLRSQAALLPGGWAHFVTLTENLNHIQETGIPFMSQEHGDLVIISIKSTE